MKRTRPTPPPPLSARASTAMITLLPFLTVVTLLLSLVTTVVCASSAASAVPGGGGDEQANKMKNEKFQKLLESYTLHDTASTSTLHQKSSEFHTLQTQFDSKLQSIQRVRDGVQQELTGLHQHLSGNDQNSASSNAPSLDVMYDDMDLIGTKVAELIRRTESVLARVGDYNRLALKGQLANEGGDSTVAVGGLGERLDNVLKEEMGRRDRYNASMIEAAMTLLSGDNAAESNVSADDSINAALEINTSESSTSTPSPYITITKLDALLSPQNVIQPSETTLQRSLYDVTIDSFKQHIQTDDDMWKSRITEIPKRYEKEITTLQAQSQKSQKTSQTKKQCLAIPTAVEMVGKVLVEHYHDGTNLVDHTSYESGGSVVYKLTSAAYVPSPRNDGLVGGCYW
mmetsp:Transcript_22319/g.41002  ORF Transcript_22319/g.41002 Transcript_22319/m.41002 type:complete len:400 (+) Transcript_22319:43-1242(+)